MSPAKDMTLLLFVTLLCQCLPTGQSSTLISKKEGREMHRHGFPLMIKALEKTHRLCPQCRRKDHFVKSTLKKIYNNFRDNYATIMSSVNANLSSANYSQKLCNEVKTNDECAADIVKSYTKEGPLYRNVNRALREQKQAYQPDINDVRIGTYAFVLDSVLRFGKLKKCARKVTYRGVVLSASDLNLYRVNTAFCWLSFTSTSMNVNTAKDFLKLKTNGVLFNITNLSIKSYWQPRDVSTISQYNEEECLYPAGTIFQVQSIKQNGNYTEIKLYTDSGYDFLTSAGLPEYVPVYNKLKIVLIVHIVVVLANL